VSREPALDPFGKRVRVDRIGTAFILRSLTEGPIVLTADDLDRLQRSLGTDPENDPASAETHRRPSRPTSAKGLGRSVRREARDPNPDRNARPRRADLGEDCMRTTPIPSRTAPRISEPQLRTIVKRVLNQPEIRGYVRGLAHLGIDAAKIEEGALKKLAPLTMKKAPKPSAAVRIHDLREKLAKERNPVVRAELTRRIEFAKLERGSK